MNNHESVSEYGGVYFSGEKKVYYFQAESVQILKQWTECLQKVVLAELPKFKYSVPS